MGGRGSAFARTSGKREYENYYKDWENETYTLKPTNSTDYLKNNKNTWVMSTTDTIQRSTMNVQSDFIKDLSKQYKGSVNLLDENNNLRIRAVKLRSKETQAAFVFPAGEYSKMQICYNLKNINQPINKIERETKNQIDMHFWSPCDKENLANHTIAHEYGHFIERTIIENEARNNPFERKLYGSFDEYYNAKSKEIRKDIYNIKKEQIKDPSKERISNYAYENNQENFAEVFANLATSKNPTNWGKAMNIYLKEKGIC